MIEPASAAAYLAGEAESLMTRLEAVRAFAVTIPMVPAARVSGRGLRGIERHLGIGRRILRDRVNGYIRWIRGAGCVAPVEEQQRRLTFLRLQFNSTLLQLDIFADALTQRSEHEHGIWLAGLDAVAEDALLLREPFFTPPPVITYLERGQGAAIRRARTRLPGGGENPVALIRVPRERLVGGEGIGASLIHEVGHQAAALLGLNRSLRLQLQGHERHSGRTRPAWSLWRRWVGEIVADFWAMAHLGAAATVGLMGVVSLPRPFVFRMEEEDPHPFPWIRVKLSCVLGRLLFPDPQWDRLEAFWESAYPRDGLTPRQHDVIGLLEETAPELGRLIVRHRPRSLRGRRLAEVLPVLDRAIPRLRRLFALWRERPAGMCTGRPSQVLAVLGQARLDGRLSAEEEASIVTRLLSRWATQRVVPEAGAPLECHRPITRRAAA